MDRSFLLVPVMSTLAACSSASLSVAGSGDAGADTASAEAATDGASPSDAAADLGVDAVSTDTTPTDAPATTYTTYALPFTDVIDGLDKSLHLRIAAGGGPSHIVQLDTGSTGIVLPRSAVGASATSYSPTKPFSITYTSSGHIFSGETMRATVVLGLDAAGDPTGKPRTVTMDIGVADTAACASGYPSCTVPSSLDGIGMLGVGFARGVAPTANAFLMLSDIGSPAFWPGYVVTGTTLTLGLSPTLVAGFTAQALTTASTTLFDWSAPSGCVTVTATPAFTTTCGELLIDTGLAESIVQTSPMPTSVIDATTNRLVTGTAVSIAIPDATSPALTFSFTTGATNDATPSFVTWSDHLHSGHPFINTGRHLLAAADVYFDAKNGQYGVRPH
ncbi:MAG: hypothetical protein ACHREM_31260 [Polyangiales bacterium]